MKPALSTSEAARWLGISKSTLIRAVNRGDIQPAFRTPGRHLRFTPEALTEIRRRLEGPVREAVACAPWSASPPDGLGVRRKSAVVSFGWTAGGRPRNSWWRP